MRQKTHALMEMYEKLLDPDFSYDAVKEEIKSLSHLQGREPKTDCPRPEPHTKSFRRKKRCSGRARTEDHRRPRPTSGTSSAPSTGADPSRPPEPAVGSTVG